MAHLHLVDIHSSNLDRDFIFPSTESRLHLQLLRDGTHNQLGVLIALLLLLRLLLRHAGLDEARHAPAGVGELGGIHDGSPVNEDQGAIRRERWWSSAFARETKVRRVEAA